VTRTRFRPSANGRLHLGGAFVAWQNYRSAKAKAGEFICLVDDVVPRMKYGPDWEPAKVEQFCEGFVEDMEWLGIAPDLTVFASQFAEAHAEVAAKVGAVRPAWDGPGLERYVWTTSQGGCCTSYHPWLVAGRVSDDHELGITDFVRGADLLPEAQLYDWIAWQAYGYGYHVLQDYTGIVIAPDTNDPCSKTAGGECIATYRARGVTPNEIIAVLKALSTSVDYGSYALRYMEVPADAVPLLLGRAAE